MIKLQTKAAAALIALLLTGCGGGGGSSAPPTPSLFPFAGKWTQSSAAEAAGTTFAIDSTGQVTGVLTPGTDTLTTAINGSVTGTITSAGAAVLTRTDNGSVYTAEGTLSVNTQGHLVGTLMEAFAPVTGPPGTSTPQYVVGLGSVSLDMTKGP